MLAYSLAQGKKGLFFQSLPDQDKLITANTENRTAVTVAQEGFCCIANEPVTPAVAQIVVNPFQIIYIGEENTYALIRLGCLTTFDTITRLFP